ncbi:hypothetical protein [Sphingomonas faeni]|uniref:hypothetical protein n=1 Tax=Sphingomonas faeni TaxID=185950 RepID=UPI003347A05A
MIVHVYNIVYDDQVEYANNLGLPTTLRITLPNDYCDPDPLPINDSDAMHELILQFLGDWLVGGFEWRAVRDGPAIKTSTSQ